MPVLPRINESQQLTTRRATPDDFGAGAARALQQVGNQVTDFSIGQLEKISQETKEQQEKIERAEKLDRSNQIQKRIIDANVEFSQNLLEEQDTSPDGEGVLERYKEKFESFSNQLNEDFPEDSQEVSARLNNFNNRFTNKAIDTRIRLKRQSLIDNASDGIDQIENQVSRGALTPQEGLDIALEQTETLSQFNKKAAQALKQENIDRFAPFFVEGLSPKTALEIINSAQFDNVTPSVRKQIKNKVITGAKVELIKLGKDYQANLNAGFEFRDISGEIQQARSAGLNDIADQLSSMQKTQKSLGDFSIKSFEEQQQIISKQNQKLRSGQGGTEQDINLFNAYQNIVRNKFKMLQEDPYTYLSNTDQLNGEQLKTIDLSDPDIAKQALDQRRILIEQQFEKEGVRIDLLTKEEVRNFSNAFKNANPEQKVALYSSLGQSLGIDEIRGVASQLNVLDENAAYGLITAQDDPETTLKVAQGANRDVEKPKDFDNVYNDLISNSIQDPIAAESAKKQVLSFYKETVFQSGDTTQLLNEEFLQNAIDNVLGPTISMPNGSKTLSFRDETTGSYLTSDDFEDALEDLDRDHIFDSHGDTPRDIDNNEIDVEILIDNADLIAVGDGLYNIIDQNNRFAQDSKGNKFVLDMRKAIRSIQERRKEKESKIANTRRGRR